MPARYICDLEAGRKNASLLTIHRLASAFEIPPGELLAKTSALPKKKLAESVQLNAKLRDILRAASPRKLRRLLVFVEEIL